MEKLLSCFLLILLFALNNCSQNNLQPQRDNIITEGGGGLYALEEYLAHSPSTQSTNSDSLFNEPNESSFWHEISRNRTDEETVSLFWKSLELGIEELGSMSLDNSDLANKLSEYNKRIRQIRIQTDNFNNLNLWATNDKNRMSITLNKNTWGTQEGYKQKLLFCHRDIFSSLDTSFCEINLEKLIAVHELLSLWGIEETGVYTYSSKLLTL